MGWLARRMLTTSAGVLLLAALPAPAHAAMRTITDRRGDAPASADVLRVRVVNGPAKVRVAIKVANLAAGSDVTLSVNQAGAGRYLLRTAPVGKGTMDFARGASEKPVSCPGWTLTRYTATRSTMVVTIPQGCFGRRAGAAWFNLTMWQAGGQGADRVLALPVHVPRG